MSGSEFVTAFGFQYESVFAMESGLAFDSESGSQYAWVSGIPSGLVFAILCGSAFAMVYVLEFETQLPMVFVKPYVLVFDLAYA